MFAYTFATYNEQSGAWTPLNGWVRPFTDGETLDESLDSGKFVLSMVTLKDPLAPFTRIRITIWQDGTQVDVLERLVQNDRSTLRCFSTARPLYTHEVETIELTKRLERTICDNMTVTNYLGHSYPEQSARVLPQINIIDDEVDIEEQQEVTNPLYQPYLLSSLPVQIQVPIYVINGTVGTAVGNQWFNARVYVTAPDGTQSYFNNGNTYNSTQFNPNNYPELYYTLTEEGVYTFGIEYAYGANPVGSLKEIETQYYVSVVSEIPSYNDWTITDVVNRILAAGETCRVGLDTQKYVFDATQASEYANVAAPEFYFTRSSVWDALMTVGGFIHAIPRLVDNNGVLTVRFDKLGQDNQYTGTLPPLAYDDNTLIGDEYCGAVDSPVENILNTTDKIQGSVTEPSIGAFRAANTTPGGIEISPNTITLPSERAHYQLLKLLIQYSGTVYDITPYLYEFAEYQTLSSYNQSTYPYSKGWAVTYKIGGNEITGLNTVVQATSAGTLTQNYAIVNILNSLGANISGTGKDTDFANLLSYQMTYIPIENARITQRKAYLDFPVGNTLFYNQSGNSVESEYYGQRMKGVMARIGNISKRRTYYFNNYADIPKCGQKIGEDYVATADKQYDNIAIKATLSLTPNFNKLAEYVGINSNYRLYDVSERQSVERYVHYDESVVVSTKLVKNNGSPLVTYSGVRQFMGVFSATMRSANPVSGAYIQAYSGRDTKGTALTPISVSAASFAIGNSLVFSAAMVDNYGAGYQSSNDYTGTADALKRAQRLVPYSDALGNLSQVDFSLYPTLTVNTFDYPEAVAQTGTPYFTTGSYPFNVQKDSREQLKYIYQLHVQAANKDIVIGSNLTARNPLVRAWSSTDTEGAVFLLQTPLNMLNDRIDLTTAVKSNRPLVVTQNSDYGYIVATNDSGATAAAWAYADPNTGEVYVGQNFPDGGLAADDTAALYFTFVDAPTLKTLQMEN